MSRPKGRKMLSARRLEKIIGEMGGVKAIDADLRELRKTARLLSSDDPRMIDLHPDQWVGLYQGAVRATGSTLQEVLGSLESQGIPKAKALVRFITRYRRSMFL